MSVQAAAIGYSDGRGLRRLRLQPPGQDLPAAHGVGAPPRSPAPYPPGTTNTLQGCTVLLLTKCVTGVIGVIM